MSENSYQSAKRDALKAAAVLGAGYVAYKGYKKLSSLSDDEVEGCFFTILLLTAIPAIAVVAVLALPLYIFWRARIFSTAEKRLHSLETRMEGLWERHSSLKQRLEGLPLTEQERNRSIQGIEKEQAKTWNDACKCASILMTALQWQLDNLKGQRKNVVGCIEGISDSAAKASLRKIDSQMPQLESQMRELREQYKAEPLSGWFFGDLFFDHHGAKLIGAVLLLWVPMLLLVYNM